MNYITAFLLLFLSNLLFAQTGSFGISLKTQYIAQSKTEAESNFSAITSEFLNDSTIVRSYYNATGIKENENFPKIGYELSSNIGFKLNPKWKFELGLGLNYLSFNTRGRTIRSELGNVSRLDTVAFNPSTTSGSSTDNSCNVSLNSLFDVRDLRIGRDYHIFSVKIPMTLEYFIIENKLSLAA